MSAQDRWNDEEIDRLMQPSLNIEPSPSFLSRVRAAVAETTVDQEIQDDLNIEPSPEFMARVRQGLREGHGTYGGSGFSRTSLDWMFGGPWLLGAGALAAALLMAIVLIDRSPARRVAGPITITGRVTAPLAASVPRLTAPSLTAGNIAAARVTVEPPVNQRAAAELAPVVARSEFDGLRRLVIAARSGQLDAQSFSVSESGSDSPVDPLGTLAIASLSVAPISIEPLE